MNSDKLMDKVTIYFAQATIFNENMNSVLQKKTEPWSPIRLNWNFGLYSLLWIFIVINKIWILNVLIFKIGMLQYYKYSCHDITMPNNSDDMKDNKVFFLNFTMKFRNIKYVPGKHDWVSSWKPAHYLKPFSVKLPWFDEWNRKACVGNSAFRMVIFLDLFQQLVNSLWFSSRIKRPLASMPRVVLQISFKHALILNWLSAAWFLDGNCL